MTRERRADARVAVPLNARVVQGSDEVELLVRDVSRRGIFLYTKKPFGTVGTILQLKLALTAGIKPVHVRAQITRNVTETGKVGGELVGMGLRFLDLTENLETQILDMLDRAMRGRGTQMRAFPRVYRLLDARCRTNRDLRALLRDIGEGGCGLTVNESIPIHSVVNVSVNRPDGNSMAVPGWIVTCEAIPEEPGFFRVGVRFGRLTAETRSELEAFLRTLFRK